MTENDNLVLISGQSTTGKSMALEMLPDHPGVMYLNTESNKKPPFKNSFDKYNIVDPYQIFEAFKAAETMPHIHTIVIDSLTFMMDQFETLYIVNAANGMKAWASFNQFFKELLQQHVANSTKNVIFTAHTLGTLNETIMEIETKVPIKGALKANGVESYFSTVVSTKVMPLKKLEPYKSPYLNITEEDERLGIKYCFQTMLTRETVNEKIRSSRNMWAYEETFIDNNVQFVLERLHQYHQ